MSRRAVRPALLLVMATAALAVAGCGSKASDPLPQGAPLDKSQYITALNEVGQPAIQSARALRGNSAQELATGLTRLQLDLRVAAGKLQDVVPPAEVSSLHTQLIASLLETANQLDPAIAAAELGNIKRAVKLYTGSRGLRAQQEVTAAMAAKGFS